MQPQLNSNSQKMKGIAESIKDRIARIEMRCYGMINMAEYVDPTLFLSWLHDTRGLLMDLCDDVQDMSDEWTAD